MKKTLLIILIFIVTMFILPLNMFDITANALDVYTEGDFCYTVSNDEVTLTGYIGSGGDVVIPSHLGGYPVIEIYGDWFYNGPFAENETITSITIPDTIRNIKEYAFIYCYNLKAVYISNLSSWCAINFETADSNPLSNECSLYLNGDLVTDLILPEGISSVSDYTFDGCTSINSVVIPNGVSTIGECAFDNCSQLTSVTLPKTITYIDGWAFSDCPMLSSVYIFDLEKWCKTYIADTAHILSGVNLYLNNKLVTNLIIPDSITYIGQYLFSGCSSIKSVTISNKVTSIHKNAFTYCENLTDVWYLGSEDDKTVFDWDDKYYNPSLFNATWHYNVVIDGEHIYDNNCDNTCNICAKKRTITHTYSNNCDKNCNLCGKIRNVGAHKYTNDCDTKCNICNASRRVNHTYSNECDKTCNLCGKSRTVNSHKYSNSIDTTCNICKTTRKIKYDYTITTDEELNLNKTTSYQFDFNISNKSIAKIDGISTSMISIGSYLSITKNAKIIPQKPGAVIITITNTSGTVIDQATVLIKEGKHKMVSKDIIKKATTSVDGKILQSCEFCGYKKEIKTNKIKTIKLSTTNYTYNNKTKTPSVTVKDSAGKTLKKNTDYTVTYASGRKNAGTYKVTVKMIGKYSGAKTLTFKINPAKISSYKLSATSYTYDGKVKKPTVTVKNSSGTKLTTSSYTATYASGRKNVGTYKVTIKGKGNYTGTKTLTFKINPAKTTVSKLTAGKKSITVAITKKSTQVTGYQIQYSTSKSFSKATTKIISSYKTTKYTLKSLSAKKTYYVRVRTYKTVGKTKYYSGWSTYKYIKTK